MSDITAALKDDHGPLKAGAIVRLVQPVRDTADWMAADPFGYVITIPSGKLEVVNRASVVLRLEGARQEALMALQQHSSRSEQAMAAARSYEIGRLLEALPKAS